MVRTLLLVAAFLLAADVAGAQITTYMAPPRPDADSVRVIAAADSARADSISQQTVENMRAWVDSAAGVAVPPSVGEDTIVSSDLGRPITNFADGAVAPATASELPALALAGLISLAVGIVLLTTRPRG